MKRLICFLMIVLLLPCLSIPVLGNEILYVADHADLLLPEEESFLQELAQGLKQDYGMDIVIVTVSGLDGATPQSFADDYYDSNGYGDDGALFLLSMAERDWYISTSGDMIYALTDYGIQEIASDAISHMSAGEYYDGFCRFMFDLPEYIDAFRNGTPVDGYADYSGDYYHGDNEETVYYQEDSSPNFLISLVSGLLVGGVVLFIMYSMMNDKKKQHGAAAYIKDGSFHLNTRRDMFLYSNLSKTRRQQQSSGSRGGGSSVHRSSGGRRHGGGGGKF